MANKRYGTGDGWIRDWLNKWRVEREARISLADATNKTYRKLARSEELDEQYLATPYYGARRMMAVLRRDGWTVNRKRVRRLMRVMRIEAIYQKPNTAAQSATSPCRCCTMHRWTW